MSFPLTHATLSRYIATRTLLGVGLAFLVVTGIIALVDFVEGSRNIGADAGLSSLQLLGLTALKVPKLIEQTIPFVVLFGVMGALAGMNRRSELTVMRAAGLSAWRFLRPAVVVTGVIGLIWSAALNPLASSLYGQYESRTRLLQGEAQVDSVWLREGADTAQRVIKADGLDMGNKRLIAPTFFELAVSPDGSTSFARRFDATTATLLTPGYWTLEGVTENAPGEDMRRTGTLTLPTSITLDELREQSGQVAAPPFWRLPEEIRANETAGFSARELRLQWHKLLALPFLLIAMTFIAAGVSMSLVRSGGTLRLLIAGSVLGFAVFFADSVVTAFGEVAILPVMLAAWTVPLIVLLLGVSHLARTEDG